MSNAKADLARIEGMVRRAVEASVDAALGEITRQVGDFNPALMKEARTDGLNGGKVFIDAALAAVASLAGRAATNEAWALKAEKERRQTQEIAAEHVAAESTERRRAEALRAALWRCRAGDGCLCAGGPFVAEYPHSERCREWMAALTDEQRAALAPSAATETPEPEHPGQARIDAKRDRTDAEIDRWLAASPPSGAATEPKPDPGWWCCSADYPNHDATCPNRAVPNKEPNRG